MNRIIALFCLAWACAAPGAVAETPPLRLSKEILRGDVAREAILAVALDGDVYAATREGFPDLRVFDRKGLEVPFVMERATQRRTQLVRESCAGKVLSLRAEGGGIEVQARLERDAPPAAGLTLVTPLVNYERRVQVFGSDDGKTWTRLVTDGLVFDYSRYMDVSNREIRLPKNRCRQFRIAIDDITDVRQSPFVELTQRSRGGVEQDRIERSTLERRPMRIDRLDFWREAKREAGEQEKLADYAVADFGVEEDKSQKATVVHVRTRKEPLTELAIQTASRNFSRSAAVEVLFAHKHQEEWREIGRAQVSRIDFGGIHRESLGIGFPEHRESQYRIVIRNGDSPPLKVTGATARGHCYRAVFLATAGETYRMGYGSAEAEEPSYDAAVVLGPLRQGHQAVEAKLGPEAAAAAVPGPAFKVGDLLNDVRFLGPAIVLLVVVLAWALVRAARRINELPKE